jgi:pre-mRNA-processing factor 19
VVTPSGRVYERRLLENALQQNGGKDPISQEHLDMDKVIKIVIDGPVRPRPLAASSIPGMCVLFQNEWDALMLETFELKKQLEQVRQELAQSLYQQDAACRVIARLIKERDEARSALANARLMAPQGLAGAVAGPTEITKEIQLSFLKLSKKLSTNRKKRVISPTLAKADDISRYVELSSHPIHKATEPGILCLDIHPTNPERIVTGGVDKVAVLFNRRTGKKIGALTGHSKKITGVLFHPSQDTIFTASADKVVRIWAGTPAGYETQHKIRTHSADVTGIDIHPSGDYIMSTSLDETWGFHDIRSGNTLLQLKHQKPSALECIRIHSDGLLVGTGTSDGIIRLWDVKDKGKNVANFSGHRGKITSIAFSENGFYMASASGDNSLKMWDLRRLKEFQSYQFPDSEVVPQSVNFDYSGVYLLCAGDHLRVLVTKSLEQIGLYAGHAGVSTCAKFGPDAHWFASTSMDRTLKFWGLPEND